MEALERVRLWKPRTQMKLALAKIDNQLIQIDRGLSTAGPETLSECRVPTVPIWGFVLVV